MDSLCSCFGRRRRLHADQEPLLPQYADDTVLQRRLHQKLHTYQQFRALSKGFMPSTEQTIVDLRTLLASDVLNADNPDLSESGRRLVKYSRQWLMQFIELLRHKNERDQIQNLIWFISKSRIELDTGLLAKQARRSKAKADTVAAYQSLKTVGSLMLLNDDFRTFLGDLNIVGREVFKASAFKLSDVAQEAAEKVEPSEREQKLLKEPGADKADGAPSTGELGGEVVDTGKVVAEGAADVVKTAAETTSEKLSSEEGQTLLNRLKQAVLSLRQRKDYSQSVSTLALLIQRYAFVYSRAASEVSATATEATHENEELDRALKNAWALITSFGDKSEWDKCESQFHKVLGHRDNDPEFENLMVDVGNSLQKMLTDPAFFDNARSKISELRSKSEKVGTETSLRQDVDELLQQVERTLKSVVQDEQVNKLLQSSMRIFSILSPVQRHTNPELLSDAVHVFVPLLINAIQYLPIPRLEVSTPDIDLLLENLIIEPGSTVNKSSFLPYRLKVETYNDVDIRRTHTLHTATSMTNLMTIKLDGLSARADEVGFWFKAHSGIFRLHDAGIASIALDERGIDIQIDVEIGRERLEQILTLKAVRVHIHKLNYRLRQSKFSWLATLLKPFLRPILRKTLEHKLAESLGDLFHAANRELLFARERLRATRIASPDDLLTFLRAVAARLVPAEDPDLYTRVGVAQPGSGVFKGVYAPGSIVKVWNEEGARAGERVEDFEQGGWRNAIFDTPVAVPS